MKIRDNHVVWSEKYECGRAAIDIQHKYLFSIINQLADVIAMGCDRETLLKVLNDIAYYADWHFCREEACMTSTEGTCPKGAAKNKSQHDKLRELVAAEIEKFEGIHDYKKHAAELHKFLVGWVGSHILKTDVPCLRACKRKHI